MERKEVLARLLMLRMDVEKVCGDVMEFSDWGGEDASVLELGDWANADMLELING